MKSPLHRAPVSRTPVRRRRDGFQFGIPRTPATISRPTRTACLTAEGNIREHHTPPLTLTMPTRSRSATAEPAAGPVLEPCRTIRRASHWRSGPRRGRRRGDHRQQHRAEDLLARHPGVVGQSRDDGRLDEEAAVPVGRTTAAAGETSPRRVPGPGRTPHGRAGAEMSSPQTVAGSSDRPA